MTQANTSMNFLPEDYVEKRQAQRSAVVFIGLLLFVVIGVVGAYFYTQMSMKGIFADRDKSRADVEDASNKIAQVKTLEDQKAAMARKLEITTTLIERAKRSAILDELTKKLPENATFVSLEMNSHEVQQAPGAQKTDLDKANAAKDGHVEIPPPPAVDVTLIMTGTAPSDSDVAAYMSRLQKSDLLTDVALLFSEEFRKDKDLPAVRKFSVEMHVNPGYGTRPSDLATGVEKN